MYLVYLGTGTVVAGSPQRLSLVGSWLGVHVCIKVYRSGTGLESEENIINMYQCTITGTL